MKKEPLARVIVRRIMNSTTPTPTKKISEVDKAFNEGTNALYLVFQLICPECNKLVRISLLTNSMTEVVPL